MTKESRLRKCVALCHIMLYTELVKMFHRCLMEWASVTKLVAKEVIDEMVKALKKFVDNDVSLHSPLPCCSVLWHFTDGIEQVENRLKKKYTEGGKDDGKES